jgi:uncharacterized protein YbdZ (MbtH family)
VNEILKAMQQTVEAIDKAFTVLSSEELEWSMWRRNALTTAITKAIQSGWIKEGDSL